MPKPKQIGAKSIAALCQKYSIPATRVLINRVLSDSMTDSDLIRAVETINARAFGRPTVTVETTVDVNVQIDHLSAMKRAAKRRIARSDADGAVVIEHKPSAISDKAKHQFNS